MDLKSNSAHQNAARWKLLAADLLDSHTSTPHRLNRRKRDASGKPTKDWTPSRNIRVVISKTLLHEELFTANKTLYASLDYMVLPIRAYICPTIARSGAPT